LAFTNNNCFGFIWRINCINTRISSSTFYIYNILSVKNLGISAFYHDSAACLLINGAIIAAAQEERFTRKKHDPSYPKNAIDFVLKFAGLRLSEVDQIVFFEKHF
jgi:hypothetical protein